MNLTGQELESKTSQEILCVSDSEISKSLIDFLLQNNFSTRHARGPLKIREILRDNKKIKIILWHLDHDLQPLQYELAEVFNEFKHIPVLIVSKIDVGKINFEGIIKSEFRFLDLYEGNRFILKEINEIINPLHTSPKIEQSRESDFNNLFHKPFPENEKEVNIPNDLLLSSVSITNDEKESLLKDFIGDNNQPPKTTLSSFFSWFKKSN